MSAALANIFPDEFDRLVQRVGFGLLVSLKIVLKSFLGPSSTIVKMDKKKTAEGLGFGVWRLGFGSEVQRLQEFLFYDGGFLAQDLQFRRWGV